MKKLNKKYCVLGISLLLCCAIGLTFAFSKDISNVLTNTFFVGEVESKIEEERPQVNGNIIDKNPKIKNTGSMNALVRVRITVSPEELCNPAQLNNASSLLSIDISDSWNYVDGWYYYQGVISPNNTIDVFNKVTLNENDEYNSIQSLLKDYKEFNIAIYQETIAATATDSSDNEKTPYVTDENGQFVFSHDAAMEIWGIYESLSN